MKKRSLIVGLLCISVVIGGCAVTRTVMVPVAIDKDYVVYPETHSITAVKEGVKVTVKYPLFEELKKIKDTPFTTFNRSLFTVFFVTLENQEEQEVRISGLREFALLDEEGNQYTSLDGREFRDCWKDYYGGASGDDIETFRTISDKARAYRKVGLERRKTIYVGGRCKGYIVFPRVETGIRNITVIVPIRIVRRRPTSSRLKTEVIKLRFNFKQKTLQK